MQLLPAGDICHRMSGHILLLNLQFSYTDESGTYGQPELWHDTALHVRTLHTY